MWGRSPRLDPGTLYVMPGSPDVSHLWSAASVPGLPPRMSHQSWYDAGFRDTIPIIPPGAELAPTFARASEVGKIPGRQNTHGLWTGLAGWAEVEPRPKLWDEWNAGVGLRTRNYPAVDIDCMDAGMADAVEAAVIEALGPAPVRYGQAPKRTLVYRTRAPFKRARLWAQDGGTHHLIEVLGAGQQFVVEGVHPGTQEPFRWVPGPPRSPEDLTPITAEDVERLLTALAALLTARGLSCSREGRSTAADAPAPVQEALAGTLQDVEDLITRLPNDNDRFPGRTDYLRVGYAIRAALPDHPHEAFRIWWDWCSRWPGNERAERNTLEDAQSDWDRMQPPYQIGMPWLQTLVVPDPREDFADAAAPLPRSQDPEVGGHQEAPFSDLWFARRAMDTVSEVRYCDPLGGWFVWDGCRWARDERGQAVEIIGDTLVALAGLAKTKRGPGIRQYVASRSGRSNILTVARTDPRIAMAPGEFDQDPWALNTPRGVVDLRTGILTPANASRLFTRATAVALNMGTPTRWLTFLLDVAGDRETVAYLQRLAGYCLTGSTREHAFAFLWGPGGNGKGVFLNTLVRVFGSYAQTAAMDTFTASSWDRHSTELASLSGARLVTAQETQEGRRWDEARIKAVTAGDPITARFMRQDGFTYQPQFKLLFAGNHRPRVHVDDAMRRRMHLIPFTFQPATPDVFLMDTLETEWPQILGWAVQGCDQWLREGLNPPAKVSAATENYFDAEDRIGAWMEERCRASPAAEVAAATLFADWGAWCAARGERSGRMAELVAGLEVRGFPRIVTDHRHRLTLQHLELVGADFTE